MNENPKSTPVATANACGPAQPIEKHFTRRFVAVPGYVISLRIRVPLLSMLGLAPMVVLNPFASFAVYLFASGNPPGGMDGWDHLKLTMILFVVLGGVEWFLYGWLMDAVVYYARIGAAMEAEQGLKGETDH